MTHQPLNGKTGEMLRWVIGLAVAVLVSYFTAQNATNERLTKVETQGTERWDYIQSSLGRIERKQDEDRAEFRRILEEWRNGLDRRTGEPLPLQRATEQQR
jgi:predicted aminopeptidase